MSLNNQVEVDMEKVIKVAEALNIPLEEKLKQKKSKTRRQWPKSKEDLTEEQKDLIIKQWDIKRQKRREKGRKLTKKDTDSSDTEETASIEDVKEEA